MNFSYTRLVPVVIAIAMVFVGSASALDVGRYKGELVVKQLNDPDGRSFEVRQPFAYIDPAGKRWPVPKGAKTNCASVPRAAWSIFPPCAGRHLKAAVVHDYYCVTRSRAWQAVHRMFFDALLASGISRSSANIMYAAVYMFGPKWSPDGRKTRGSFAPSEAEQKEKLKAMEAWIKANKPSLEEIENKARRMM